MVRTTQPLPQPGNRVAAAGPESEKSQGASVPSVNMKAAEEESQISRTLLELLIKTNFKK